VPSIEQLDEHALLELSRPTHDLGVLSVYVGTEPGADPNLQGAAIDLKNRYSELQRRVADGGWGDRSRDVAAALERLRPRVESLTSPVKSGRSKIWFAALTGDWELRLDSDMPVPSRVVLDDGAFIHPLLELLDEGRTAGVVLVSGEEARILEWRLGRLRPLTRMELEEVQAAHERAGQIGGGPGGQFHTPMREQAQSRDRDRSQKFLDQVVDVVTELAGERRWARILVSGGARWTESVAAGFPAQLQQLVVSDPRVLAGLDEPTLASTVTERLQQEHDAQEQRLVKRIRDASHAQRGALGLSEVAAALNAGRVAHLVYDPQVRYTGSVSAEGTLYGGEEAAPDGRPGTPEPRLTERLVEQALATGAHVSPVEGAAQNLLEDAAGIAALLRW
jgi:peptide subunit release factor 1 (eRF1)